MNSQSRLAPQGVAVQISRELAPMRLVRRTTGGTVPVRLDGGCLATEFDRIRASISRRALELFERNGRRPGNDWNHWFRAEAELLRPVPVQLEETVGQLRIRAEVPGFTVEDLEINLEPRRLKIAGTRKTRQDERKGSMTRFEVRIDRILRSVDLPADVDRARAAACLRDGVLTIDLPKAAHASVPRIVPKAS